MARDDREVGLPHRGEILSTASTDGAEPSLGELFKRLTADTTELIRHEIELAKVELRETGTTLSRDAAKIGAAAGVALAGVLALATFLILGLGDLFDNYVIAALLVGVLLVGIAAYLARSAVADIKRRGLMPKKTVQTLRDDVSWAKQEGRELERELKR
jgi:uncharacterized membrane protein YqjE